MNRKHPFLYDKLRFAKRKTTKRQFNFMPIKQGLPEAGDVQNKDITLALSPPKWASSPRETPAALGSQRKKKKFVDISLIEPLPGAKVPEPKQYADPDDRTINLAALRAAAGHNEPKTDMKEKDVLNEGSDNKNRVGNDLKTKQTDEKELEKSAPSLSKVQSSKKESNLQLKEADTQPAVLAASKGKPGSSLEKDSEESVRKIWQSVRRRSNSGSSKVSKSRSSKSGSQSSGMGESENDVRKTSKFSLYKNSKEAKEVKGSSSEGSSSRAKRSKSRNEEGELVTQENVPTAKPQSQRLSETRKSDEDSANSPDKEHQPRERRGSIKSSDSAEDVGLRKRSTDTITASASSQQRKRKVLSESEKLSEEVRSKIRKSSESGKSSNNEFADIDKRSSSSAKSLTKSLAVQEKRVKRSSSSEKSAAIVSTAQKKRNTRSSSSEKSAAIVSTAQKKRSTRSSSSEKSAAIVSTAQKKRSTRSSSSEKSAAIISTAQKKYSTRSSSSEKSAVIVSTAQIKRNTRSSSSEKSTAIVSTAQKKRNTRSCNSEKSTARVLTAQKKRSTRSSSSEKSTARVTTTQKKHDTSSSSSEKPNARMSITQKKRSTKSSSSEKSTSRVSIAQRKHITRSSSSKKSTARISTTEKKRSTRSSSSEKSTARVSTTEKKRSTRSSSSEKSTARVSTTEKKRSTRSSSSEKSTARVSTTEKKRSTRSSSSEKSTAEVSTGQKIPVRSSSSFETASFKNKKSINREKFVPEEAHPSTSRAISHISAESNMSAGEGPSKSEMVFPIFLGSSKRLTISQLDDNSSSEEKSSIPNKWKLSKPQITSEKKGAKFKKGVMSKPTKVAPPQSSAESPSTDEDLFNPQKNKMSTYEILRPKDQLGKPEKLSPTKLKKGKPFKSQGRKPYGMSQNQSDSDENFPPAKGMNLSASQKNPKRRYSKDVSEEMSEVISLQDKPVIASFAGLPLLDNERGTPDKSVDQEENIQLEDSMQQFEEILDTNKEKLSKMYDTSRELRLNLLQPRQDENIPPRSVNFVTDLDILWNFIEKSLSLIIKEADDAEHKSLIKSMRTYLGRHFNNAIHERLDQKKMITSLKHKSKMINVLTLEMLRLKQKNRQLAKTLYEKEEQTPPEKNDEILTNFENFSQTFAQFKRK